MCSIAGAICKNGKDAVRSVIEMLEITRHRGPDGAGITNGKDISKGEDFDSLSIEGLEGKRVLGHLRLKITGEGGIQPLTDCSNKLVLVFNGEIWNYEYLRDKLSGHDFETDSDSEVVIHLIEEFYEGSLKEAVAKAMNLLDGDYAFAVMDSTGVVLARDPVGIKQLYYAEGKHIIAISSERKALWNQGLEPKRVRPGDIVSINGKIEVETAKELEKPKERISDESEALRTYEVSMIRSVKKRIKGHQKIGIIFSGGVDSALVAKLAHDLGADVTCYTAGLPDSDDVVAARKAASEMGLRLKVNELSEAKILEYLPEIIEAIEDWNQLQVEVSLPVFASVKEAKKERMRVLLTGQGADELFAGYDWYPQVLSEEGEEGLEDSLWNDIKNLYKETLEREDKITMHNSVELRVPFLDPEVIDAAMSASVSLKTKKTDDMRKHLHRKLAEEVGVPHNLAWRKKDAAQYGSNVHETLESLAGKLGFSSLDIDYHMENEELGSVYRYKDSYGSQNTQLFLDTIAYNKGLMDTETRKNFEAALGSNLPSIIELIKKQRGVGIED